MKKLIRNKKGFTLAEMMLVVAIIVILSGATIVGVSAMLNRSKESANRAVSNNANFESDAVLQVNQKTGNLPSDPVETETLNTPTPQPAEAQAPTSAPTPTPVQNQNDPTPTPGNTNPTTPTATEAQSASGSGGATNNFTNTSGTHWDGNDTRENPWGSNVPDTTSQGSISFGSKKVSSFTVSVSGKVMEYSCNDWRYSITDNGNGTYTITYTANQYEYNPPISDIGLRFKVDGDKAADIKVTEYTEYK